MTSPALQDILALFGCPAAGNPAQYLFERAIEAAGLDCRFLSFDVAPDRLAEALAGAAAMGFRGCLLSGPLRNAASPLVAALSPAATFTGAVTLVERQPAGFIGHVTDGRGAAEALRSHLDLAGTRALILGAAAGGRATALEVALAGAAEVLVCDPDAQRAEDLARSLADLDVRATTGTLPAAAVVDVPATIDLVVIEAGDVKLGGLRGDLVVADLRLAARTSAAATQAAEHGACIVSGIEIHAARAAIDFQMLTGTAADPDLLQDALDEFLS